MHISLHVGGLLMIVKMGRGCVGGSAPPEKLWRICVIPLNASNYINIVYRNRVIILYSVFLVCLSSHFEKLGQSDLDKKIHIKSYRKCI